MLFNQLYVYVFNLAFQQAFIVKIKWCYIAYTYLFIYFCTKKMRRIFCIESNNNNNNNGKVLMRAMTVSCAHLRNWLMIANESWSVNLLFSLASIKLVQFYLDLVFFFSNNNNNNNTNNNTNNKTFSNKIYLFS